MDQNYQILDNRFVFIQQIGKGGFGNVYKALDIQKNKFVAIKEIQKQFITQHGDLGKRLFSSEINGMKYLHNPYLLHCYELYIVNPKSFYIVMDFCNGGLLSNLIASSPNGRLSESQSLEYLRQILAGLSELHKNDILHRDLKQTNIMLRDNKIVIIDLGFSKQVDENNRGRTQLGTMGFMAPEIMNQQEYDSKVDIFSLGVILFCMLHGYEPYDLPVKNQYYIMQAIQKEAINFQPEIKISNEVKQLIVSMLKYKKEERISFEQIYQHPLIQEGNGRNIHNIGENDLNIKIYQGGAHQKIQFKPYEEIIKEFKVAEWESKPKDNQYFQLIESTNSQIIVEQTKFKQLMVERGYLMFFETVGRLYQKIFYTDPKSYFIQYGLIKQQIYLLKQLVQKNSEKFINQEQKNKFENEELRLQKELQNIRQRCENVNNQQIQQEIGHILQIDGPELFENMKQIIVELYYQLEAQDSNKNALKPDEYNKILIITILLLDCALFQELKNYLIESGKNIDEYVNEWDFLEQSDILSQRLVKQMTLFD